MVTGKFKITYVACFIFLLGSIADQQSFFKKNFFKVVLALGGFGNFHSTKKGEREKSVYVCLLSKYLTNE